MMNAKDKPRYHLHGLAGYSRSSYVYIGCYRWKWLAKAIAYMFVGRFPYGCAVITDSKNKPKIEGG